MKIITLEKTGANSLLLHQQIKSLVGEKLVNLATFDNHIDVTVIDEITPEDELAIISAIKAHDGTQKASIQVVYEMASEANANLRNIVANRIEWHEANPVTTGNAVQVLQRIQAEWIVLLKKMRPEL